MSLMQLSTELLLLIASDLSQLDLLNVALTSKHLRAATESALYREYHPPSLPRRSLYVFIKALLKDPERLRYVHSLRLPEWEILAPQNLENKFERKSVQEAATEERKSLYHVMTFDWGPYKVPGQKLGVEDYELFTNAAVTAGFLKNVVPYGEGAVEYTSMEKSHDCYGSAVYYWYYFSAVNLESLSREEKFCHLLRAGVDDAYIVLLLSLLTSLRRLSLRCVPTMRNALPWEKVFQRYTRLREFTALPDSRYDYVSYPLALWGEIIEIPTMENLTVHSCTSGWVHYPGVLLRRPFTLISESLNIQRLVLEKCPLEYRDLKLLLESCHNLKSFRYSTDYRPKSDVTSAQVFELLAPFQMTLEDLLLNKDSNRSKHDHDLGDFEDHPIRSLAHFTQLERLWIPTNMWGHLPGVFEGYRDPPRRITFTGLLPPHLKVFRIFDSRSYTVLTQPVRDDLLEVAKFELLELETIDIVSQSNHAPEMELSKKQEILREVETEICRASGSTFTYKFRWDHFAHFELLWTAEELELRSTSVEEPTCWDGDRYVKNPWSSLYEPDLMSTEEEEQQVQRERAEILECVELEHMEEVPACNDQICELLEEFEGLAMDLEFRHIQNPSCT